MRYLINNFNDKLEELNNKILFIKDKIDLCNEWETKNILCLEKKKSFIKSEIRYSQEANCLRELIFDKLKFSDFNYTDFYPMMHLSHDKTEAGGFHFDQVDDKKIYTLWIAVTNYNYKGLSISNFNFSNLNFNKILIKSRVINFLSKSIDINRGDAFLWPGTMIHAGNLNTSKNFSFAMQLKILKNSNKFSLEKTYSFNKSKKLETQNSLVEDSNFKKRYLEFEEIIKLCYDLSKDKKNNLPDNISKLKKNISGRHSSRIISFALSILAQRIIFACKKKYINLQDSFAFFLDISSILMGNENLISLKRLENRSDFKIEFLNN